MDPIIDYRIWNIESRIFYERLKCIPIPELNISLNQQVANIESEINLTKDKIKSLSSQMVIEMMEKDIEELQQKKVKLIQTRDNKEDEQVKIETLIAYAEYFMEHLHDLLLGGTDKQKNAAIFGLVFDQIPTYNDLINGTPKLSPLFKLNDAFVSSKNNSVSPLGLEPRTNSLKGCCSTIELWTLL